MDARCEMRVMHDLEAGLSLEERLARFDASKAAGEEDRLIVGAVWA